jgi:hypothetical protein
VSRARRPRAVWMPRAVPLADMVPAPLSLLDGATDIPVSVIVPESAELALMGLIANVTQNPRSSSFQPNPNRNPSKFSTALRPTSKYSVEPRASGPPGSADLFAPCSVLDSLSQNGEYRTTTMH